MPHDDSTYTNIKAHPLIDGYARLGIDLVGRYLARRRRRGGCRSAGRDDADLLLRWGVLGPVNTAGGHALAYPLGTRLKLPHGLANAIIFPHVLAFNASACPDKTAGVASMLGLGAGARANDILTSAMELLPGARHRNASVAPWRTGARFADLGRGGLCHKAPDRQQPPGRSGARTFCRSIEARSDRPVGLLGASVPALPAAARRTSAVFWSADGRPHS
ncbi:iron-containing alcohol dehydrogenase [Mesorhizobium sp.]|uniref:iron-containing alcohol dehydrogenase n=1 Tax=Mesorhizobium sp. TaxID=1871066 RepID=UPI000FE55A35|nr:iron-containing alcohol dehydrogenase [Mesorhizobium sp.]RWP51175.1 MAG: iron-containing alcohol dehydrogenase [Mesorhizobium sp.]